MNVTTRILVLLVSTLLLSQGALSLEQPILKIQHGKDLIAHVPRSDGSFTAEILLENNEPVAAKVLLLGFAADGSFVKSWSDEIGPNTLEVASIAEMFGDVEISHIQRRRLSPFESPPVDISIRYGFRGGEGSPARAAASPATATTWRLFPGNWAQTWDGIAVVNTGGESTPVTVRQVDTAGTIVDEVIIAEALDEMAKTLYVLGDASGSAFEPLPGASYEIVAEQPIAVTALRGSGSEFLWPVEATRIAGTRPKIIRFGVPETVPVGETLEIELWAEGDYSEVRFFFLDLVTCTAIGCGFDYPFRRTDFADGTIQIATEISLPTRVIVTFRVEGAGPPDQTSFLTTIVDPNDP